MNIPLINTRRLKLRAFAHEDAEPLHAILQRSGMMRYFPDPNPPTMARVERIITTQLDHWQTHGYGWWALERRSATDIIGWCGLTYLPETGETEVAYLLSKEHWGKGLAQEAARAAIRFGFDNLRLDAIVGIVHPENAASRRVLEKVGMSETHQAEYFGMMCCHYQINRKASDILIT